MMKMEARKEVVKLQMTSSGLANADLEHVRRIRRIAEVLAELTHEYEAKPNPENLESSERWVAELANLSVRLRTISREGRSAVNQARERKAE